MAFDPDEYLNQASAAPPPAAFDPDAYLAAQPSAPSATPLPKPRPEEAPSMTPAVANAPLPQERPESAPPRLTAADQAASIGQPLYNELESVGRSFKRGVHSLRQGGDILLGAAESRPLNNLTAIERRIAAGEKPEDIPDNEDLFGARFMTPEKRAQVRSELETNIKGSAQDIAAREADIKSYPVPPEVERVANAKTFREGWEAFKESPIKVIAHLGAESLPQAAPALVGAAVAGPIGGLTAAGAMTGAGSYGTDYASEILDGL